MEPNELKLHAIGRSGSERSVHERARPVSPSARLHRAVALLRCAARYWIADNASTTGAALAFYCASSIAPLQVILLSLAGLIMNETAAYSQIGAQLAGLFGPATAKVLLGAVQSAQHKEGPVATVVSIVTLVIGATTVLAALQTAFEAIWKGETLAASGVWGWVRIRLLSFGFILALGFLLLVSLTLSTGLANLRAWIARLPGLRRGHRVPQRVAVTLPGGRPVYADLPLYAYPTAALEAGRARGRLDRRAV